MNFLEWIKIIVLGIVEGVTEWLPISSTGHMLLVDEFLQLSLSAAFKEMFFVVIQLGAILAVVVIFWRKMFPFQFRDKTRPCLQPQIFHGVTISPSPGFWTSCGASALGTASPAPSLASALPQRYLLAAASAMTPIFR